MTPREDWIKAAHELGVEHAKNAASWIADGNTTQEHIRNVLRMLDEGDPGADLHMPAYPNLSGEFADGPTPASLYECVTGRAYVDAYAETGAQLLGELADAYDAGVSETFESACEAELRKWVSE